MISKKVLVGVMGAALVVLAFAFKNTITVAIVFVILLFSSVFAFVFESEGSCSIKCESQNNEVFYEEYSKAQCKKLFKTTRFSSKDCTWTFYPDKAKLF